MVPFYVLLGLTIVGFLVLLDRRDRRDRDERAELMQRIQAPHAAVAEHHARVDPEPVQYVNPLPMSDAEIAEAQGGPPASSESEKEALIAWMERMENGSDQIQDGVLP